MLRKATIRTLTFLSVIGLSGCAVLEEPAWPLLGDTDREAYLLDRLNVKRQNDGSYSYRVKRVPYQQEKRHALDNERESYRILFLQMNCETAEWTRTGRGVVDRNGDVLFRQLDARPRPHPVEAETSQQTAFNYLCVDGDLAPLHNHQ
jgi:hypothetical protein